MEKRYLVILNPVAGHGNGLRVYPEIDRLMVASGLNYTIAQSNQPGKTVLLAKQGALDGYDVIVAAGGDGTVNEVVNGIMQARGVGKPHPAMGVLAAGRGNDFAGSASIPETLEAGVRALVEDHRKRVDIGIVKAEKCPEGRFFANCVGAGFDTIVGLQVARMPRWGGYFSYLLAVLKTAFLDNRQPLAAIELDSETIKQRSLMISIMNGVRLGGGFYTAPDSKMDDGLLDLCIVQSLSTPRVLTMLPHFLKGTQSSQPEVRMVRSRTVKIHAEDGALIVHTDGEVISMTGRDLAVELLPAELDIIYHPKEMRI